MTEEEKEKIQKVINWLSNKEMVNFPVGQAIDVLCGLIGQNPSEYLFCFDCLHSEKDCTCCEIDNPSESWLMKNPG